MDLPIQSKELCNTYLCKKCSCRDQNTTASPPRKSSPPDNGTGKRVLHPPRMDIRPKARRGPASSPHQKVRRAAARVSGTIGRVARSDGLVSVATRFSVGSSCVMVLDRACQATLWRLVGTILEACKEGRDGRTPNADTLGSSHSPHTKTDSRSDTLRARIVPYELPFDRLIMFGVVYLCPLDRRILRLFSQTFVWF